MRVRYVYIETFDASFCMPLPHREKRRKIDKWLDRKFLPGKTVERIGVGPEDIYLTPY